MPSLANKRIHKRKTRVFLQISGKENDEIKLTSSIKALTVLYLTVPPAPPP